MCVRVSDFMPMLRRRLFVLLCWLAAAVSACGQILSAASEPEARSPLQGDLQSGASSTGFRTLFRYDNSRTWKETRRYGSPFSPDLQGRPIQINIWYPAIVVPSGTKMRFADYVDQSAPERFAKLNAVMNQRNRDDAVGSVARSEFTALQSIEMNAYRNAQPASGRFPAVLYFAGLNSAINSNAIMAEYLASHGYVVASISLIGPSDEQAFQSRTSADFEASVRDMEFAWSVLQGEPNVDSTKLAVMDTA